MDAIKTPWERRVAITGKVDIFIRRISRRPHSALTGFQNAQQTLWHRRLV